MLGLVFACVVFLNMQSTTIAQNTPQDYLNAHNTARSDVRVADITWSDTMEVDAQAYADHRKGDCNLTPSGKTDYGENIFWGSSPVYTGTDAVNSWVSEKPCYYYNSNACESGQICSHFTQVVWNNSTHLGCASVECDDNAGVFIICYYSPPGNLIEEKPYICV